MGRPCYHRGWPKVLLSEVERPVAISSHTLCDWLPHWLPFLPFMGPLVPMTTQFWQPKPVHPSCGPVFLQELSSASQGLDEHRHAWVQAQICSCAPCHHPRCCLLLTSHCSGQALPPMTAVEAKLGLAGPGQDFSGLAKAPHQVHIHLLCQALVLTCSSTRDWVAGKSAQPGIRSSEASSQHTS